jgi:hypothetical protein
MGQVNQTDWIEAQRPPAVQGTKPAPETPQLDV